MEWSIKEIDAFVEDAGGCAYDLLDTFPFTESNRRLIEEAFEDEETYTDSFVADLIIDLAYKQVSRNYKFDDTKQFPKAVELAMELDDALCSLKYQLIDNDKIVITSDEINKLTNQSSQLHEIMRELETQAAFPKE